MRNSNVENTVKVLERVAENNSSRPSEPVALQPSGWSSEWSRREPQSRDSTVQRKPADELDKMPDQREILFAWDVGREQRQHNATKCSHANNTGHAAWRTRKLCPNRLQSRTNSNPKPHSPGTKAAQNIEQNHCSMLRQKLHATKVLQRPTQLCSCRTSSHFVYPCDTALVTPSLRISLFALDVRPVP